MSIIVNIGIFGLNILYFFMKCLPVQNKITYISRQMDVTPLDFQMIIDETKKVNPDIQHVVLAKMLKKGMKNHILYCFHMLKQMYHIATSKMVILDTYCIPVCILKQRSDLVVIQIWHALGAFKKFGYSILDQPEGSSSKIAHLMRMHKNYTYVFSSSEYTRPFFADAFHVDLSQVKVFPLPKTDLLIDEDDLVKAIILNDKDFEVTFFNTFEENAQDIINLFDEIINYNVKNNKEIKKSDKNKEDQLKNLYIQVQDLIMRTYFEKKYKLLQTEEDVQNLSTKLENYIKLTGKIEVNGQYYSNCDKFKSNFMNKLDKKLIKIYEQQSKMALAVVYGGRINRLLNKIKELFKSKA